MILIAQLQLIADAINCDATLLASTKEAQDVLAIDAKEATDARAAGDAEKEEAQVRSKEEAAAHLGDL